ncbi:MAG: hypothetical protein U9O78_03755 [Patescibacteria group bacterium]|nr:hypothetical protein [Patescibacteria group bacterium]
MKITPNWFKKFLFSEKIVVLIFIFNLLILFLHLFKASFVQIDNTTILLMVLLLITPFAAHIKKIKWGDFEAELLTKDIEKLKEQAEGLEEKKDQESPARTSEIENELHELTFKDPSLAIVKLRIEIEIRLKRLFVFVEKGKPSYGIRVMTQTLATTGKISNKLRNIILDINGILNRVAHGEDIPTEAKVDSILGVGIDILNELDRIFYEELVEPESTKIITNKQREEYTDALYEVTTVVPLVKNPTLNKRALNQEQLDQFLDGYDEFAEFLVEIKKL